jgi:hypothetical protein
MVKLIINLTDVKNNTFIQTIYKPIFGNANPKKC